MDIPPTTPGKTLLSITFTKRESDPTILGTLYDVQHNFADGTSLLSIHRGDNFDQYRPPSNVVACLENGKAISSIPATFLNWLTFSE